MPFDHLCGLFAPKVFPSRRHSIPPTGCGGFHTIFTHFRPPMWFVCHRSLPGRLHFAPFPCLTFTQILLLCNHVIDNFMFDDYYQGGSILCALSQVQSRCGGLDSRIDNGEVLIKKFGLRFKVRWVVVALNGLQHISHWNKQIL
jgi:hypothetical protein